MYRVAALRRETVSKYMYSQYCVAVLVLLLSSGHQLCWAVGIIAERAYFHAALIY
jgi:hypothetical protein